MKLRTLPRYRCDWCGHEALGINNWDDGARYFDQAPEGWPSEAHCSPKCKSESGDAGFVKRATTP